MNPILHAILVFLQTWWVELVCGVVIVAVVPLVAGYVVLVERKLMADMRRGWGRCAWVRTACCSRLQTR